MTRVATIAVNKCFDCPYFEDEEIDYGHGCLYYPPKCKKADQSIRETVHNIPEWCPLPKKED